MIRKLHMHFFFSHLIYGGQWTLKNVFHFSVQFDYLLFSLLWTKIDKILLKGKNILVIQPEQERLTENVKGFLHPSIQQP